MRPTVAVGAIAFDRQQRVLVVKRGRPPGAGLWTVPGGRVESGETLHQACAREVAEETGLVVEPGPLVCAIDRIGRDAEGQLTYHFVILDYLVTIVGGQLAAASDASAAEWVTDEQLRARPTTDGLLPVIAEARSMLCSPGPPLPPMPDEGSWE